MKYPQLVSMPSAVSDWLEEQLEARGIDAVVYTRYVLSLLYRDPIDIICPDQDLHFSNPNKEARRSGGGRKRFCRSAADYWGRDADQLKRSAAVECLKSASDQKCGIESLVDELCEKLKQVKSESSPSSSASTTNPVAVPEPKGKSHHRRTPRETRSLPQDPAKRYYAAFPPLSRNPSPSAVITLIPKWIGSPQKKKQVPVGGMKAKPAARQHQRFGYFRNKSRVVAPAARVEWDGGKLKKEMEELAEKDVWDCSEESMYDDLPVDIRDLLDSPSPNAVNVEMMNMANVGGGGIGNKFISSGTNIISSIWSTDAPAFENSYNMSLEDKQHSSLDSYCFGKSVWSNEVNASKENETNSLFESYTRRTPLYGGRTHTVTNNNNWNLERWADVDMYDDKLTDDVSQSLLKLNHNKESSSFTEVKPRPVKIFEMKPAFADTKRKKFETEKAEDLLNSTSSHFKPINEKLESKTGQYADGTTFVIPSNLDKVNYRRSDSGTMYLDAEFGVPKKYLEYKKVSDELTLKFSYYQNDKACQTEGEAASDYYNLLLQSSNCDETDFYFPGDQDLLEYDEKPSLDCTCFFKQDCPLHTRPDSMMAELFGKVEIRCDKCSSSGNNNIWDWEMDENKRNIWSNVCMACVRLNDRSDPPERNHLLRDDIKQDGEQLLSDLSSLQKSYMEGLIIVAAKEDQPADRQGPFSFASRLQEKMAAIPTLRSVTL